MITQRLAAFGDVHGNVAALDAVLADLRAAGIDRAVCTGDLVLRGLEPEACVSRIALSGWPCVRGNTDAKVASRRPRPRSHPASERPGSRSWTAHRLSDTSLAYLAGLPLTLRVPLGPFEVLVLHGTPDDPTDVLVDEATPHGRLIELAAVLQADCVITGHTHRAFVREASGCLFVNPGSTGESTDHDHRPSWALIEAGPAAVTARIMHVGAPLKSPHTERPVPTSELAVSPTVDARSR
jgi:putative phosphoesterase